MELWTDAMQGDRDAFGILFHRHYPLLFQYGSKICTDAAAVEDALQELFAELWQRKKETEIISVQAYLLQALKYKLYKMYRKRHQQNGMEKAEEPFELSAETFLIGQQEDAERIQKVLAALDSLPPRQKEIIYLKIYKGLSYEEISAAMGLNYQVVRNLLCQALKMFRKTNTTA